MLLEVKNLQKSYGDFHLNCSLEIKEGCVTGLIGANGAGKKLDAQPYAQKIK